LKEVAGFATYLPEKDDLDLIKYPTGERVSVSPSNVNIEEFMKSTIGKYSDRYLRPNSLKASIKAADLPGNP